MAKKKQEKTHRVKQDAVYTFLIVLVAFFDRLYNRVLNREWTHKGKGREKYKYNQEIENEGGDTWRYLGNNVVISTHRGAHWIQGD